MKKDIPPSLRYWFNFHFFIDFLFALPLFIAPQWLLGLFGFMDIAPVLARLVGAALLGIGITSLLTRTKEQFELMLMLKIIWSASAIVGFVWSLAEGAAVAMWAVMITFIFFLGLWSYYQWKP